MKLSIFFTHIKNASKQTGISLEELILKCKASGIEGVDIEAHVITDEELELINKCGLKVSCVCKFCDFIHGDDSAEVEKAIDLTKRLDSRLMLIPGLMEAGDSKTESTARIIKGIKPLVEKADAEGIKVCMEFFDSEKSPFSNGEELMVYLENIPSLYCTFDVGNLAAAGDNVKEWLDKLKDRIGHFHLKDKTCTESELTARNPKKLPGGKMLYDIATGYGVLPMDKIVAESRDWGYDGYYTLEFFDAKNMWLCIEKATEWFKTLDKKLQ